jgi:hypothetical protein
VQWNEICGTLNHSRIFRERFLIISLLTKVKAVDMMLKASENPTLLLPCVASLGTSRIKSATS